jgi:two-component system sensor histidine kinase GlrK
MSALHPPRYPRSFLKLILIGFALVTAPLVIALGSGAISMRALADQSERAVYQSVRVARDSRVLAEEVTAMERGLRQYAVLNDASLLEGYGAAHEKFSRTLDELRRLPLDAPRRARIERLASHEEALHQAAEWAIAQKNSGLARVAEGYPALADEARGVLAESNALIDREVETLRAMAGRSRHLMAMQLLALLPVALLLILGFSFLIARPIRQLDAEIRRLGQGALKESVSVDGPEDLRRLGERLDWMRSRLLALEEQKTRFLRQISHELKTPLTALREGAELLSEGAAGALAPSQREIVDILRHNTLRLQALIEDLLNFNALRSGTADIARIPVRLDELVREAAENQRLALQAKAIRLDAALPGVTLNADPSRLRTVLDNLLSNAIKFSPRGGSIKIRLMKTRREILLDVADEGPGVAEEDRERIFEPFCQGRRQPSTPVKGSGLGLAIAREMAQAHGGALTLAGGASGACFRLALPLDGETA